MDQFRDTPVLLVVLRRQNLLNVAIVGDNLLDGNIFAPSVYNITFGTDDLILGTTNVVHIGSITLMGISYLGYINSEQALLKVDFCEI